MAIYVYDEAEQFIEDVDDFHYSKDVSAFVKRIEERQSLKYFDLFPPPYLKKRFERQIRMVGGLMSIDGHEVVCLYRIFKRSSNEYASFVSDTQAFGKRFLDPLVDMVKVKEWLKKRIAIVKVEIPAPSHFESQYLWSVLDPSCRLTATSSNEYIIYESRQWVNEAENGEFSLMMLLAHPKIFDAITDDMPGTVIDVGAYKILAKKFPEQKILYLAAAYSNTITSEALMELQDDYSEIINATSIPEEVLLKRSTRAYPDEVLCDVAVWTEI